MVSTLLHTSDLMLCGFAIMSNLPVDSFSFGPWSLLMNVTTAVLEYSISQA